MVKNISSMFFLKSNSFKISIFCVLEGWTQVFESFTLNFLIQRENLLGVSQKRGSRDVPLVGGKQQHVRTRRVHLVGFTRVNSFFLDSLNLQCVQFLIKHLRKYRQ